MATVRAMASTTSAGGRAMTSTTPIAARAAVTAERMPVTRRARRARARLATGILSAVTAALAAIGVVLVMARPPADVVLAIALTVAMLLFGVASILLLRPRR